MVLRFILGMRQMEFLNVERRKEQLLNKVILSHDPYGFAFAKMLFLYAKQLFLTTFIF